MPGRERETMREKRLYEASLNGDVQSLHELIQEDGLVLARTKATSLDETPLHVAAIVGHVDFTKALLGYNPGLAQEIDSRARLPLHWASANGFVEIVDLLLTVDPDGCLARDEDIRTPLHLAVEKGRTEVVRKLGWGRPEVMEYRLEHGETALHTSVVCNRLEVVKVLVEVKGERADDFVNLQDDAGNTALHTAIALKRVEIVRYLLNETGVNLNTVNRNGSSPCDIMDNTPRDFKALEIREMLTTFRALRSADINPPSLKPPLLIRHPSKLATLSRHMKKQDNWLKEKRESLLVSATVIAAMAFQAGVNPPSGTWQENKNSSTTDGSHSFSSPPPVVAGTSIMADINSTRYHSYLVCNTVAFLSSLSVMVFILLGPSLKRRIWMWILTLGLYVTITFTALTYMISIISTSPRHETDILLSVFGVSMISWMALTALLFLLHTVRFIIWITRKVRKYNKHRSTKGVHRSTGEKLSRDRITVV